MKDLDADDLRHSSMDGWNVSDIDVVLEAEQVDRNSIEITARDVAMTKKFGITKYGVSDKYRLNGK